MLVVTRHRPTDVEPFLAVAKAAFTAMSQRPGFAGADLGRAVEDPGCYVVVVRWQDAGAYRRALSPVDTRALVLPLYASADDSAGVFEVLYALDEVGAESGRRSDLAGSDAGLDA